MTENPALHMIDTVIDTLKSVKTWIPKEQNLKKIQSALKLQELVKERIIHRTKLSKYDETIKEELRELVKESEK